MLVAGHLFLNEIKYVEFATEVPTERWFRAQRKGLGYEAWLYVMIRVARAQEILQWGFDETSLDGTPTLNQWVLVQEATEMPKVSTLLNLNSNSNPNSNPDPDPNPHLNPNPQP